MSPPLFPKVRPLLWIGLSALVAGGLTAWIVGRACRADPGLPFSVLTVATVPVAIDIEYWPELVRTEGLPIPSMTGPARVTFSNLESRPIKVAFPPRAVFSFSQSQISPAGKIPEFAADRRIVEIPANGSIDFEIDRYSIFPGNSAEFRQGGPGFLGFVFGPPHAVDTDEDFLVGTVFSHYYVVGLHEGDDADAAAAREARIRMARSMRRQGNAPQPAQPPKPASGASSQEKSSPPPGMRGSLLPLRNYQKQHRHFEETTDGSWRGGLDRFCSSAPPQKGADARVSAAGA